MQDRIIRRMHEVFGYGLDLLERLEMNENPRFETEHNRILTMLLAGGELDYDPTYRGDLGMAGRAGVTQNLNDFFLGVQYALACWLDEIFLLKAPAWWSSQWEADTMEVRLYQGSQSRGWRFWNQAKKAEGPRGSPEALEAYLWAVMLGFRGDPDAEKITPGVWVDNVRRRVLASRATEFPVPTQREVVTNVPQLRGAASLVLMLRVGVVVTAVAVFALCLLGMNALK